VLELDVRALAQIGDRDTARQIAVQVSNLRKTRPQLQAKPFVVPTVISHEKGR
jgi:hypothetical protein